MISLTQAVRVYSILCTIGEPLLKKARKMKKQTVINHKDLCPIGKILSSQGMKVFMEHISECQACNKEKSHKLKLRNLILLTIIMIITVTGCIAMKVTNN